MVCVLDVSQRDLIDFLVSKPFCPVDTKIVYLSSFRWIIFTGIKCVPPWIYIKLLPYWHWLSFIVVAVCSALTELVVNDTNGQQIVQVGQSINDVYCSTIAINKLICKMDQPFYRWQIVSFGYYLFAGCVGKMNRGVRREGRLLYSYGFFNCH